MLGFVRDDVSNFLLTHTLIIFIICALVTLLAVSDPETLLVSSLVVR